MKKNFLLLFSSILFSIFLLEFYLILFGNYKNLTKNNLIPSNAIFERSHSSIHHHHHPDLDFTIINYYDYDGVKNFDNKTTSKKKNIIGFFGDSFTENIAVYKDFEFSNILNQKVKNYKFVNYGVGGYSADQVFIRYLKYQDHDIKYIFYLLMPGDQGFSTKSIFNLDGTYYIDQPKLNFFWNFIGKLNLTYFFIDVFYLINQNINKSYSKNILENYSSILSNKIYNKFYNKNLKKCLKYDCKMQLFNLLRIFNDEAKKKNSEFFILLYPHKDHINFFKDLINIGPNDLKYFILDGNLGTDKKFIFKNDPHWNEYGSIFLTKNILHILSEIGLSNKKINTENYYQKIKNFYINNK